MCILEVRMVNRPLVFDYLFLAIGSAETRGRLTPVHDTRSSWRKNDARRALFFSAQLGGCAPQDLRGTLLLFGRRVKDVKQCGLELTPCGGERVGNRAAVGLIATFRIVSALRARHSLADAREFAEQGLDALMLQGYVSAPFIGQRVELLRVQRLDLRIADVNQVAQSGVDHPRTRRIKTVGPLADRLDHFVSVARLFGQ